MGKKVDRRTAWPNSSWWSTLTLQG